MWKKERVCTVHKLADYTILLGVPDLAEHKVDDSLVLSHL
jgi:hypothetical protein